MNDDELRARLEAEAQDMLEHFRFGVTTNDPSTLDRMQQDMSQALGCPVVCRWEGDSIVCQPAFYR